jgi:hypothetical protein
VAELLDEARALAASARWDDALPIFEQVPRCDRTPAILIEMGRACLALENDQAALSYASEARDSAEAIGSSRDIAAAMCIQGEVLLHERRRSDAQARFRDALQADPECETARTILEREFRAPARSIGPVPPTGGEAAHRLNPFQNNEDAPQGALRDPGL